MSVAPEKLNRASLTIPRFKLPSQRWRSSREHHQPESLYLMRRMR
jgi:hypothetical protein